MAFKWKVDKSSWIALRIKYGAHTNPYFINFKNLPVAIKESAEWCRNAVEQCWKQKQAAIREQERPAAAAAYELAKRIYEGMME